MTENLDKDLHHVERFDLDLDQKIEILRTFYYIMKGFVDRAWGVDPVQQSLRLLPVLASPESKVVLGSDIIPEKHSNDESVLNQTPEVDS